MAKKVNFNQAISEKMLEKSKWVKTSKKLPPENVSVLVFIPEEDNHVTTGMWDVSKKWVLLDEYRVPKSEVTYWHPMINIPKDQSYNKIRFAAEDETTTEELRNLRMKVFELERILREVIPS